MRITVTYSENYIKRKGYEGLTSEQINKLEIERLNRRFLTKEVNHNGDTTSQSEVIKDTTSDVEGVSR